MAIRHSRVLSKMQKGMLAFWCPGCNQLHAAYTKDYEGSETPRWTWNGDIDKPTFRPSLLVRWTEGEARVPKVCHSFVTDGTIDFLTDSTHALAGKTVRLPDLPKWMAEDDDHEGAAGD